MTSMHDPKTASATNFKMRFGSSTNRWFKHPHTDIIICKHLNLNILGPDLWQCYGLKSPCRAEKTRNSLDWPMTIHLFLGLWQHNCWQFNDKMPNKQSKISNKLCSHQYNLGNMQAYCSMYMSAYTATTTSLNSMHSIKAKFLLFLFDIPYIQ